MEGAGILLAHPCDALSTRSIGVPRVRLPFTKSLPRTTADSAAAASYRLVSVGLWRDQAPGSAGTEGRLSRRPSLTRPHRQSRNGLSSSASQATALAEDGKRLDDADALFALGRGDRLRQRCDRLSRLGAGVAVDERVPRVTRLTEARIERDTPEQWDPQLGGQTVAAAAAEGLAAHVLDHAEQAHVGLLGHQRRASGHLLRERLRCRHDHGLGAREELAERDRDVAGTRWH